MRQHLFVVLMVLVGGLLPDSPARAQNVTNCTNGCYISTCSSGVCTVWYCNSAGCRIVGSYRQQPRTASAPVQPRQLPEGGPAAFNQVCNIDVGDKCPIQTCVGDKCTVSIFDGQRFLPLTQTENVEHLIRRAPSPRP